MDYELFIAFRVPPQITAIERCNHKYIFEEIETTTEPAEEVTEVVEKVAEEVEKTAEEIADQVPSAGKLRTAAVFVENVADETAKDARIAEHVIDKVQRVIEEADSIIEPGLDKVNEIAKEAKAEKH